MSTKIKILFSFLSFFFKEILKKFFSGKYNIGFNKSTNIEINRKRKINI